MSPTTFQGMLPPQSGPPNPSNPGQMPGLIPPNPLKIRVVLAQEEMIGSALGDPHVCPEVYFPLSSLSRPHAWFVILENLGFLQ